MVQITRSPTLAESASDAMQDGLERARGVIDTVADRASTVADRASEAVDTVDVESVKSIGRGLMGSLQARDPECTAPVEAARDDERLKSAAIAGAVIFIISLIVLLLAREVAKRRATHRSPQRALDHPEAAVTEG